jgi:hypothetical protein
MELKPMVLEISQGAWYLGCMYYLVAAVSVGLRGQIKAKSTVPISAASRKRCSPRLQMLRVSIWSSFVNRKARLYSRQDDSFKGLEMNIFIINFFLASRKPYYTERFCME